MAFLSRKRVFTGVSVAVLAMSLHAQAHAQSTPAADVIEEIVVTARQRQENLKDVPASVTALTSATLQAAGVQRAQDFLALTAGVSFVQTAEQGDVQVNIRGANGARDAQSNFAFVVDGIQIANPSSFNREFTDLRQIEIVKGPQGAIYGRNAAAGAMIVTTNKPSDVVTGMAQASAGSYGTYTARAGISSPITDQLSGGVSADWRKVDGQYKNEIFTDQRALDAYEGYNLNGRLVFKPSAADEFDFKVRYGSLNAGSINFNAVFALPAFTQLTKVDEYYEDANNHRFQYQNDVEHKNHQDSFETSLKYDHKFDSATLTLWGLYSDIHNSLMADGTAASFGFFNAEPNCIASTANLYAKGVKFPTPQALGPTPGASFFGPYSATTCDGYQFQRRNQKDASIEARLTSSSDQALRWLVGAYYLHIDREVGVATGIDAGGSPPSQLYVAAASPYSTEQLLWDRFKTNVGSVFGQAQYDITSSLEGSLALRYDTEARKSHNLVPTAARTKYVTFSGGANTGGAPLNPALDPTLNPAGVSDQAKTYKQLQPKVGLRWAVSPALSVYGDWGVGFKSGGFNNQGSKATIDAFINPVRLLDGYAPVTIKDDYAKEVSKAFELGAKGRLFDGRVTFDAAVFDTDVENMQVFDFFVGPFGLLRVVSNIDKVNLRGAELGGAWRATSNLRFEVSGGYTDSEIKKNASRPETVGNESPSTPKYTWNFATQYDRPILGDMTLQTRVDVRGTGPTWFHSVQNQANPTIFEYSFGALGSGQYGNTRRQAYALVDLRVGVSKDAWSLTAYGRNIFDKKYLSEVITAPEFGGAFASPGTGAVYGAEFSYKF